MTYQPIPIDLTAKHWLSGKSAKAICEAIKSETGRFFNYQSIYTVVTRARKNGDKRFPRRK